MGKGREAHIAPSSCPSLSASKNSWVGRRKPGEGEKHTIYWAPPGCRPSESPGTCAHHHHFRAVVHSETLNLTRLV